MWALNCASAPALTRTMNPNLGNGDSGGPTCVGKGWAVRSVPDARSRAVKEYSASPIRLECGPLSHFVIESPESEWGGGMTTDKTKVLLTNELLTCY